MKLSCCTPRRAAPDPYRKVRYFHTCAALKDVAVTSAAAGLGVPPPATRSQPIHSDCQWHLRLGVPYTTSGNCTGPACTAYAEAHADDANEVDA